MACACGALGELPLDDDELAQALVVWRDALSSKNVHARFSACHGAKALGKRAAPIFDALETTATGDPDSGVRFMAGQALKRLTDSKGGS